MTPTSLTCMLVTQTGADGGDHVNGCHGNQSRPDAPADRARQTGQG
jgi:hypothetical protein